MPRLTDTVHCLALLGPTCSGKTEVALTLASALGAEIISCDSMQVYRGLDIGTAKPTLAQQAKAPHHLIDVAGIDERYDANRFVEDAGAVLRDIRSRGRLGLLVGGTGLYAKCLIYGRELPPADPNVSRAVWEQARTEVGRRALIVELLQAEGNIPERILENPRRLARSVEHLRITGQAFPGPEQRFLAQPLDGFLQCIIYPAPDEHRTAIQRRIASMLNAGWIEEVMGLSAAGLLQSPTARQALGYQTIFSAVTSDPKWPRRMLEQRLFSQSWSYARRQRTWFRHQHPGAIHLPLRPSLSTSSVAKAILSVLNTFSVS